MSAAAARRDRRRRPDGAALVIALLLVVLAGVVAWDAASLNTGAALYSRIGPKAFPYGVATGLAILALATAVSAFRSAEPEQSGSMAVAPILWIVGGLLVQLLTIAWVGFSIATGAVFAATARAFGRGPLYLTYPLGVACSLAIWLLFARGLQLILPAGPLERLF